MKTGLIKSLVAAVAVHSLFVIKAASMEFECKTGGYTWRFTVSHSKAILEGIDGTPVGFVEVPSTVTDGEKTYTVVQIDGITCRRGTRDRADITGVSIPETIETINGDAFRNCKALTEVVIPKSVRIMTRNANRHANPFYGCDGLKRIDVEAGSEHYISVDGVVFNKEKTEIVAYPAGKPEESYEVPTGVTMVGQFAFAGAKNLTRVKLPYGLVGIGLSAFWGCSNLSNVNLPSTACCFDAYVFGHCPGVADENGLVILNGVLFSYVDENEKPVPITIPTGVETILENSFENACIIAVTIPASIRVIGGAAFSKCYNLQSITLTDGLERICSNAFYWDLPITTISIPKSVIQIENGAFCNNPDLKSAKVPSHLKERVENTELDSLPYSYVVDGKECGGWWDDGKIFGDSSGVYWDEDISITYFKSKEPENCLVAFCLAGTLSGAQCDRKVKKGSKLLNMPIGSDGSGRTFAGWWTAREGGKRVTMNTIVTEDMVLYPHWAVDGGGSGGDDTPDSTLDLNPEEAHELHADVEGVVPTAAASEYNGYLYDEKSGDVKGTIQVKVGKPGKDSAASVKATVVIGTKKVTLKAKDKGKAVIEKDGQTEIELIGGEACEIALGAEGLAGYYGAYIIDGSRNFFASKDKGEANAANSILSKWLGSFMVVWDGGSLSVSIAAKGRVKVSGSLADGKTKVSASTVLLVGEEWSCVSVAAQKANLAFVLWLSHDGQTIEVEGLGEDVHVGLPGALGAGAKFRLDAAEFAAVFGQAVLPYLPDGIAVMQSGAKWTLPKAGKVAYMNGAVDESKLGENPCGLKLTYKAKDGTFKGSFKVYAEVKGKPKATTVNVTGLMLNGVGYGTATIKGKNGSVAVTIE